MKISKKQMIEAIRRFEETTQMASQLEYAEGKARSDTFIRDYLGWTDEAKEALIEYAYNDPELALDGDVGIELFLSGVMLGASVIVNALHDQGAPEVRREEVPEAL